MTSKLGNVDNLSESSEGHGGGGGDCDCGDCDCDCACGDGGDRDCGDCDDCDCDGGDGRIKYEGMGEVGTTRGSLTLAVPKFQRKRNKMTPLKGAMSRGHSCLRSTISWRSHYFWHLLIHKILLQSYEEDMKQISSASTNHNSLNFIRLLRVVITPLVIG